VGKLKSAVHSWEKHAKSDFLCLLFE